MVAAERWRAAEACVSKACGLLAGASGFAMEMSLPLLEDARRLLATAARPGVGEQAAARDLAVALARAGTLAREAAAFYRECATLGATGARAYNPLGAASADSPSVRTLAEG